MPTGGAYSSGHLVPSLWDLHMFYLLRPILFLNLSLFSRTMLFKYHSVLSRYCFEDPNPLQGRRGLSKLVHFGLVCPSSVRLSICFCWHHMYALLGFAIGLGQISSFITVHERINRNNCLLVSDSFIHCLLESLKHYSCEDLAW